MTEVEPIRPTLRWRWACIENDASYTGMKIVCRTEAEIIIYGRLLVHDAIPPEINSTCWQGKSSYLQYMIIKVSVRSRKMVQTALKAMLIVERCDFKSHSWCELPTSRNDISGDEQRTWWPISLYHYHVTHGCHRSHGREGIHECHACHACHGSHKGES